MMRRPFVVSGIVWHEVELKVGYVNTVMMEDILNEHLQLSHYGNGLQGGFAFIFIAARPDQTIQEEKIIYSRKKKELYIQTRLPYELVEQYERPQVLQLMAATYLRTIQRFDQLKIKDFNHQQFAKDVQALFEAQGWLVSEKASYGSEP
ncbi:MAG: hypothetical protein SH848_17885 [Saprospiraceae bacterium]|nr:hypothetical protein [Saprospiraceae bacterium]